MQKRQFLEQRVPGLVVEWKAFPTLDSTLDALGSGSLDIATGSPTSFLAARERSAPLRVLSGVSELPIAVVTSLPSVRSLSDLRWGHRAGVTALKSQDHVLLRMAALRELGDWAALDPLVTARTPVEAYTLLAGGREVAAQVLSPPYLDQALSRPGVRIIVDGREVSGGPLSSVVAYSTPNLRERQRTLFAMFLEELERAVQELSREPEQSAELVAAVGGAVEVAGVRARSPTHGTTTFSARVRGLSRLAGFLVHTGDVRSTATDWEDLAFPDAQGD